MASMVAALVLNICIVILAFLLLGFLSFRNLL